MTDKQQQALDKMAENARELGLDYDPAGGTQVSKVWWEGEKLMAKPIPLKDIYQPAPVQEPVAWINAEKRTFEWNGPVLWNTPTVAVLDKIPLYTTPPAAQRQWVPLTDEELKAVTRLEGANSRAQLDLGKAFWAGARWAEAQLKEKNT